MELLAGRCSAPPNRVKIGGVKGYDSSLDVDDTWDEDETGRLRSAVRKIDFIEVAASLNVRTQLKVL